LSIIDVPDRVVPVSAFDERTGIASKAWYEFLASIGAAAQDHETRLAALESLNAGSRLAALEAFQASALTRLAALELGPAAQNWTPVDTSGAGLVLTINNATYAKNFTQTYVDMAAAAIADMLLPTDDQPFGILPTPEPDLTDAKDDPRVFRVQGPSGEMIEKTGGEIATRMLQEAKESAEKAEKHIWDELTECQWHAEVRSMIDEAAKIGASVLKGPVPKTVRSKKIDTDPKTGQAVLTVQVKTQPVSKHVSVWNIYPDPACGEDIQRGSYVWEEDKISGRALRDLKDQIDPEDGTPYYLGARSTR
jgi:hypothetical protein